MDPHIDPHTRARARPRISAKAAWVRLLAVLVIAGLVYSGLWWVISATLD